MVPSESESWVWRAVYGLATAVLVVALLLGVRGVLNPFLLFVLLAVVASPFAGTRSHLLLLGSLGALTLLWLLSTTGFLLAPFFLSLGLAYVFHPLIRRVQGRRVSRTAAIALLALPLVVGLVVALLVGAPLLAREVARFIDSVPTLLQTGVDRLEWLRLELARRNLPLVDEAALARLRPPRPEVVIEFLQARRAAIAQSVWRGVLGAGRGLSSILTVAGYLVLTPILTFYLLRDWDGIVARLAELVPRTRRTPVFRFAREYDALLSRYLRGQLLAAALVGVLTGVGFWLVGFPYALLLGVVAGVFNIVPYLGLIVSLVPALIIAVFSGAVLASLGKILLVFSVVQILDGSVIGPRIVGESVGLHPVWVILALSVFGFFFGFVGLLLAIPLAVLLKLLLALALARYRRSSLFLGQHA
jgi:predicted PurR-regulated permease PerM